MLIHLQIFVGALTVWLLFIKDVVKNLSRLKDIS